MISVPNLLLAAALLPLLQFLLLTLFSPRANRIAAPLACSTLFLSFALSIAALLLWIAKPEFAQDHYIESFSFPWITPPIRPQPAISLTPSPDPLLPVGFLIDTLTIILFSVFTFLAFLIHLASIPTVPNRPSRYFALLGLTTFATLASFLAQNALQLFLFWPILSLAFFLLIAFHRDRRAPVLSALSVLLTQSVGDIAFLIAIGLLILHTGRWNLPFYDSQGNSALASTLTTALGVNASEFLYFNSPAFPYFHWLTWTGIFFILAAAAKAAQFPLQLSFSQIAQAPPAAIPLLILSAASTGIYLLARTFPILTLDARLLLAILGCATLLIAALIAIAQTDLRKRLAWIAASQIGYVFLFLGAGAYVSALLHLFTCLFLLTALFLAAAVILRTAGADPLAHQLHHHGGLWKRYPFTAAASLVPALALAGAPWLSAAFSRNPGLADVLNYARALAALRVPNPSNNQLEMALVWIPTAAVALNALALLRFWSLLFAGKEQQTRTTRPENTEPPLITFPLVLLTGFALAFWFDFLQIPKLLSKSLPPALSIPPSTDPFPPATWAFITGTAAAIALHYAAAAIAWLGRIPGIKLLAAWLAEAMFFEPLYAAITLLLRTTGVAARTLGESLATAQLAAARLARKLGQLLA